jgi:hypothetical protein
MPAARQLLGAGEPGRTRADDRDPPAGPPRRHDRRDPAFLPAAVDDRAFDRLDRNRVVVKVQRARRLARRRADPTGEFRKIVGRMQGLERRVRVLAINQIVPARDQIVDRAAVVAERNAAIHAARGRVAQFRRRQRVDELPPAQPARRRLGITAVVALDFEKAGGLTHQVDLRTLFSMII